MKVVPNSVDDCRSSPVKTGWRSNIFALDENTADLFRDEVDRASDLTDGRLAIDCIHESLQDAIDLRKPICASSGRCCRFEEFGHRLFITTLELAAFVARSREVSLPIATSSDALWDGSGCPFQVNGLCGVHSIRPFGCRIFFCDPTADQWQVEQYERLHRQIKQLHERFEVKYFYVEWREALRVLGISKNPGLKPGASALGSGTPMTPVQIPLLL